MSVKYVKDANGKVYEETINPSTQEPEYRQINVEDLEFVNGQPVPVRNRQEALRQQDGNSHTQFFAKQKALSPQDERQKLRRKQALEQMVQVAVQQRVDANGPNIRRVSDEDFMEMRNDPEFEALSTYAHKLTTPSGKVVRPILSGEVGVYKGQICVLQDGEKFHTVGSVILTDKE